MSVARIRNEANVFNTRTLFQYASAFYFEVFYNNNGIAIS